MPQIIFRYKKGIEVSPQTASYICQLVAKAASTEARPLTEADVDWIPQQYELGARVPANIAIEIRTIGYPDRIAKMDEKAMRALKFEIIALREFPGALIPKDPILWVQFLDPQGVHV